MAEFEHGGNLRQLSQEAGRAPGDLLDFSANINPLGPPDWLRPLISSHISDLVHYPDPESTALTVAAAHRYHAATDEILTGNGSAELLALLARAAGTPRAIIPVPSYSDYSHTARLAGMDIIELPLNASDGFALDPARLAPLLTSPATVFIGQPNNPTGCLCPTQRLRALVAAHPESLFIVDEAFGDFVEDFDSLTVKRPANVAVLLSLTKIFAIPGLRLGCAVADASLARRVRQHQPLWSVNTLAQAVGVAALEDTAYVARSRTLVRQERDWLQKEFSQMSGLVPYPGAANFVLVRLTDSAADAASLAKRLLTEYGIAIRPCGNFRGLDNHYFRVAVRPRVENERLISVLQTVIARRRPIPRPRRTPAIMFQGTTSNAGKSVMTAALCRILLQDFTG